TVLVTLSKLLAPFTPFLAENMYQNLVRTFDKNAPESVHLCDFPKADEKYIDEFLETGMKDVLSVVVLGRAARNKANIKNRQPLSRLMYNGKRELSKELRDVVKDELNVKDVQLTGGDGDYVTYELKPQLKTLGPKYGALLGKIRGILQEKAMEIVNVIKNGGPFMALIDGKKVELAEDDLLISAKNKEGFSSESDGETTVVLDTALNDDLILEGIERELVSKIQNLRKEAGFEVTDHIVIGYRAEGLAKQVLERADFLSDVLADDIKEELDGYTKELDINGYKAAISVKRV
ncbi:MAG: class I tRNA ligase family protein, partial [Clostridia bacterium]|nr:class I tRNA ligase family protein [Clostridia bacterium]